MKKYKIIFCGFDEKVFQLLTANNEFHVVAVNLIVELGYFKSINPVDLLFKIIYRRMAEKSYFLNSLLLFLLSFLYRFGSDLTKKYYLYLKIIGNKKITVINFNQTQCVIDYINKNNIDLLIVSNWWLLPDKIIYSPKFYSVNIHPSKLPEYRGSVPTLWSLKNKKSETAVTLIKMNSTMDGGDIISQHIVPIYPEDDAISLEKRCDNIIKNNIINDITKYLSCELIPFPQRIENSSVTPKYVEYQKINWQTETKEEIINKIKLYPYLWPLDCCYFYLNDKKIIIRDAKLFQDISNKFNDIEAMPAGSILASGRFIYIKTINGLIKLQIFKDISWRDSIYLLKTSDNFKIKSERL